MKKYRTSEMELLNMLVKEKKEKRRLLTEVLKSMPSRGDENFPYYKAEIASKSIHKLTSEIFTLCNIIRDLNTLQLIVYGNQIEENEMTEI